MTEKEIHDIVDRQRKYFQTGATLSADMRIAGLRRLYTAVSQRETEIREALKKDLGKSGFESYMCETGMVLEEISYMLKHIRSFSREKRRRTPLAQFHSRSYQKPSPYGVTLIMSPWNYPFMLTLSPLVDALAAGNTAVVKPSAYSPHTSRLILDILSQCFEPRYVAVVTGGRAENTCLLQEHFDYIFFTGSQSVGKEVMRKAAEHLTPITLELGGKSPCIVEETADLALAARRIVWGKCLNAGQTCVAPDYLLVQDMVKNELVARMQEEMRRQYPVDMVENPEYPRIVNEKHFTRLRGLMEGQNILFGGGVDPDTLKLQLTLLDEPSLESPVMQEEIFGPVLPVISYHKLEDALRLVASRPKPLACYLFSGNRKKARYIFSRLSFGGGCYNDVIVHLTSPRLPFGGIGNSGMGSCHGKAGFDTFTHWKSVLERGNWPDIPMRYPPYQEKFYFLKKIMR